MQTAKSIDLSGFQEILDIINAIVYEKSLKELIDVKIKQNDRISLLSLLIQSYIRGGFSSMLKYYKAKRGNSTDNAVREVTKYIYNVFRYTLVKYLRVFDVFYRYHISKMKNMNMDEVNGIGLLLQKLEYNALTPQARIVSDYGVPFKIVDRYDKADSKEVEYDDYEQFVDHKVKIILDRALL